MGNFFASVFLPPKLYKALGICIGLFIVSFFIPIVYVIAWTLLCITCVLIAVDCFFVYKKNNPIKAHRTLPEKLSNSDNNPVLIQITSFYTFKVHLRIIDEIPDPFQIRDFHIDLKLAPLQTTTTSYELRPTKRGVLQFGNLNVFIKGPLGLIVRRIVFNQNTSIDSYPSFIQMKKYQLMAFSKKNYAPGQTKIRKLGTSLEFEQIRDYQDKDDMRYVNWRATAKANKLMVNQYQDTTSQSVYCILDKSRAMQMPFNNLQLLDYAINATLAISNIILKKNDRVGLLSLAENVQDKLQASNKPGQLERINQCLYNLDTNFKESNYGELYNYVKTKIPQRSLLLLFTNFESISNLNRQLPYLRAIAKKHLLVVVFFENTLLEDIAQSKPKNIDQIFDKVIAEKFTFEKRLIVQQLTKYGIASILTKPESLTIQTINKYLQIKAKGNL
ncbi:DUF58 domain-containing protein [Myroides sp. LJL119]